MHKILVILILILSNTLLFSNSVINKIKESLKNNSPFQVEFIQQVYTENEKEIEESGIILFKNINLIKWEYLKPEKKIFLIKNKEYVYYNKEENQVKKGNIDKKEETSIWRIFFTVKGFSCKLTDKNKIMIKDKKQGIKFIVQFNRDFLPIKVIQDDNSGIVYHYIFKNYKKRIKLTEKDLIIDLPENVEIVEY